MTKKCFVIMPIGDQEYNGKKITAGELKEKYDNLIKVAIHQAYPSLEVIRIDDLARLGSISNDILTYLMHADYVIADVSYPNPNVYYELGLRHAVRTGTIIIKDTSLPSVPFDIAHLRHYEYENTLDGLNKLSGKLKNYFEVPPESYQQPDNDFLQLASLIKYEYPNFSDKRYLEDLAYLRKENSDLEKSAVVRNAIFSDIFPDNKSRGFSGIHRSFRLSSFIKQAAPGETIFWLDTWCPDHDGAAGELVEALKRKVSFQILTINQDVPNFMFRAKELLDQREEKDSKLQIKTYQDRLKSIATKKTEKPEEYKGNLEIRTYNDLPGLPIYIRLDKNMDPIVAYTGFYLRRSASKYCYMKWLTKTTFDDYIATTNSSGQIIYSFAKYFEGKWEDNPSPL